MKPKQLSAIIRHWLQHNTLLISLLITIQSRSGNEIRVSLCKVNALIMSSPAFSATMMDYYYCFSFPSNLNKTQLDKCYSRPLMMPYFYVQPSQQSCPELRLTGARATGLTPLTSPILQYHCGLIKTTSRQRANHKVKVWIHYGCTVSGCTVLCMVPAKETNAGWNFSHLLTVMFLTARICGRYQRVTK